MLRLGSRHGRSPKASSGGIFISSRGRRAMGRLESVTLTDDSVPSGAPVRRTKHKAFEATTLGRAWSSIELMQRASISADRTGIGETCGRAFTGKAPRDGLGARLAGHLA